MISNEELIKTTLEAIKAGRVCLIPTDTVPGLAFDPSNETAKKTLEALKGRPEGKGFVCLVPSADKAFSFWKKLHGRWEETLQELWPASLTVIFEAAESAPPLICKDNTVALRVPKMNNATWVSDLLEQSGILATTSVNDTGDLAKLDWFEAAEWCNGKDIFVPMLNLAPSSLQQPSTIIRIHPTHWRIVRKGPVTTDDVFATKAMQQEEGWSSSPSNDTKTPSE